MKEIRIRPKVAKGDYKTTSLRLPQYVIEYYDKLADQTFRSRSELMEIVLTEAMDSITIDELKK